MLRVHGVRDGRAQEQRLLTVHLRAVGSRGEHAGLGESRNVGFGRRGKHYLESDTRDQNHFLRNPARRLTVSFYVTFFVVVSGSPRTPVCLNVPNVPN